MKLKHSLTYINITQCFCFDFLTHGLVHDFLEINQLSQTNFVILFSPKLQNKTKIPFTEK